LHVQSVRFSTILRHVVGTHIDHKHFDSVCYIHRRHNFIDNYRSIDCRLIFLLNAIVRWAKLETRNSLITYGRYTKNPQYCGFSEYASTRNHTQNIVTRYNIYQYLRTAYCTLFTIATLSSYTHNTHGIYNSDLPAANRTCVSIHTAYTLRRIYYKSAANRTRVPLTASYRFIPIATRRGFDVTAGRIQPADGNLAHCAAKFWFF